MRVAKTLALAFAGPVTVIVAGSVWGNMLGWDLTQPQAVVIAAVIGGPFLIVAAWLAFTGQAKNRQEERDKFNEQMKFEDRKFRAEMKLRRRQARADAKHQARQLQAQLTAAAELEREKQRRARAFDLISQAISAVLALRTALLAIPIAVDRDYKRAQKEIPPPAPWDPDFWSNTESALDDVEIRRASVSEVAAVMMVLGYDEPYLKLMDLANLVGEMVVNLEPPYETHSDKIGPFMVAYGNALVSLRGVYEPVADPVDGGEVE